ncbi:helix-turn-helix domain-containing protein [Sorangium sp. So ce590]|uniref:helix-turn-helix domain-containing protein n=1 Tax=unclassified Sorangium TaxID=2621164 RepID=UPI003F5E6FFF
MSRYREQQRRGKYPRELRERAEAYAKERCRAGATPSEIAAELGVRTVTASRWVSGGEGSDEGAPRATPKTVEALPFVPVVVRPERRDASAMRLRLAFADGTRMQVCGLSARDLVEAIDAVRRGR